MTKQSLKEKTAQGLFWGAMNNGTMQLVGVLFGILLGRLLDRSDYGMIAMITVFSLVATALQNSGFSTALVNMDHPEDNDYNSVFWFNIIVGLSLYALLFLCAPFIARFYHQPALIALSRYAFVAIVFSSLGTVQSAYIQKRLMVKQRTVANVSSVLLSSSVGVVMAWQGYAYWSLATQTNLYVLLNTLFYWYYSSWRPTLHFDFGPVRRMFRFSSKLLATTITTQINNNVLNILLGHYFKPQDAGDYNQAFQWSSKASYLVQGMVDAVALPVLAGLRDDADRQMAALRKMMRFTAFLSFPLLLGFGLVSHEFIVLTIGAKWTESATLIRYLCVSGAVLPLCTLMGNIIISKGRSNIYFGCTLTLGLAQIGLLLVIWPYGLHAMVLSNVVLNVVWLFVWHAFTSRLTGYTLRMFLLDVLPFALAATGVMVLTYAATASIGSLPLLLAVRMLAAALLYFGVMKLTHATILDECIAFFKSKLNKK